MILILKYITYLFARSLAAHEHRKEWLLYRKNMEFYGQGRAKRYAGFRSDALGTHYVEGPYSHEKPVEPVKDFCTFAEFLER